MELILGCQPKQKPQSLLIMKVEIQWRKKKYLMAALNFNRYNKCKHKRPISLNKNNNWKKTWREIGWEVKLMVWFPKKYNKLFKSQIKLLWKKSMTKKKVMKMKIKFKHKRYKLFKSIMKKKVRIKKIKIHNLL